MAANAISIEDLVFVYCEMLYEYVVIGVVELPVNVSRCNLYAVRLWEVSVSNRQSLLDPFVWLTSKMTQPQGMCTLFLLCLDCTDVICT